MIDYIIYRYKLWKLGRDTTINEEVEEEHIIFDEKEKILLTEYYTKTANKHLVPLPDRNNKELWITSYLYPHDIPKSYLTTKGIWELKKLIRQEKKERREGALAWMAAVVGIIGALTGLMAVISKMK